MNESAFERVTRALRAAGCKVVERTGKASATCPSHEDRSPSLSVTEIPGERVLVWCHVCRDTELVVGALGLTMGDLYDQLPNYRYDDGRIVKRRYNADGRKIFPQDNAGPTSVLYHLTELQAATEGGVFLCEGEADVHAIEWAGGVATTAPQGASSFHKVDIGPLAGRNVWAVVDRDSKGDEWAAQVAAKLDGVVAGLRFVHAKEGKDASDHLAAGHTLTDFVVIDGPEVERPEPSAFARTLVRRSQLRDLPPVEPLIEDVMSLRSTVVLVGPTGAGKTFVGLSWACSIGTGHDWLGHPVRQCRVLYTVGEGANGLDDRVTAWEQAWNTKVEDEQVVFSVRPASLIEIDTWVEMRQEALALGCRVIVLDTFSSLAPDADETKDAAKLLRRMADLAAAIDGSVVLVHHPGWGDAGRARGGYQLEANADEVLILHGNAQSDLVQLERKKVKEAVAGDKMWLRRRPLYGSVIIESATAADAEVPLRDQVLGILATTGEAGATGPQLIKELGLEDKRSSVYKVLGQLRKDGSIDTDGPRGREKYRVADSDV